MQVRTIVLLANLKLKDVGGGKSQLNYLRDEFIPVVSKLEPGDCLFLYNKREIHVYDELGEAISALNSSLSNCSLPHALQDVINVVHSINVDERVLVFLITDNNDDKVYSEISRIVAKEPGQNIYDKNVYFHIWTIGRPDLRLMYDAPDAPKCELKNWNKIDDIKRKHFEELIFIHNV